MTCDQPSARDPADPLSDEDEPNVSEESDGESELEQMLTAFYAD
ncbi:hypothetical protein [Halorussus ruber]|nr:hypothetical protein [Halorussus ruber]